MLRLLKFFGFFLLLVGTIFILVVYPNRDAFLVVFDNGDALAEGSDWAMKAKSIKGITEFIQENPQYVSYISTSEADTIALNVNESRTMGMLSSVILLHHLLDQNKNQLNNFLSKDISLDTISLFQLPKVYQTSHDNAIARLQKDELISTSNTISTKEAIKAMLVSNDLAIHDYFYSLIDQDSLSAFYQKLNFKNTDRILPFIGIYASINPSLTEVSYKDLFQQLSQTPKDRIDKMRLAFYENFQDELDFRNKLNAITEENGKGLKFDEERNLSFTLPQTTASDMHQYLSSLIKAPDSTVEASVFSLILAANQNIYRDRVFTSYAGVFDNRIGLQNGMDWGISKEGSERIQVVFFDELPIGFWFHLSSDLILQDIQQRMIWDSELRSLLPNMN